MSVKTSSKYNYGCKLFSIKELTFEQIENIINDIKDDYMQLKKYKDKIELTYDYLTKYIKENDINKEIAKNQIRMFTKYIDIYLYVINKDIEDKKDILSFILLQFL